MKTNLKTIEGGGAESVERTSGTIQAEIEQTERALIDANATAEKLAGEYDTAIRHSDEAAEKNERASAAAKRAARRAELRLQDLNPELAEAIERERAAARDKLQAEARAEVDAFMRTADTEYAEPASRIAAFLAEYARVDSIALDAGIKGPSALRCRAGEEVRVPDGEVVETYYIDEHGNETGSRHPPGAYRLHPQTGEKLDGLGRPLPEYRTRTRTRIEKGSVSVHGSVWQWPLSGAISAGIWTG